jgi:hypothetical protein
MKPLNKTTIALVALELSFIIAIVYGAFTSPIFIYLGIAGLLVTWIAGVTYLRRKGWIAI